MDYYKYVRFCLKVVVANISRTPAVISSRKTYQRKIRLPEQFITAVKKLSNIKVLLLIIFLRLPSFQKN